MTPFDLVIGGVPRFAAEAPWAWRLLRRYATRLECATRTERPGQALTVAEARGESPFVLIQADPESYLLPRAAQRLLAGLAEGAEIVIPVSNEPWTEEARAAPPFAYTTPSQLEEAVEAAARGAGSRFPASGGASPVFALRRETLARFAPGEPLEEIPARALRAGCSVFVDPGAYLHRYGAMDAQAREDLAERVPEGARSVLDVGCSRGATARALRARGVARLVGIEPDREDAAAAAAVYDRVIARPLEEVGDDFAGQFDAVLFGDVLEHLVDPAEALTRVRPWLARDGAVIASVPNFGHWAVVADLIEGRFEYVPYSTLSGTHIRFFTRRTMHDLFGACGYAVDRVDSVELPPSPAGTRRLARLAAFPGASPDLTAAEFLIVARPHYDRRP
ncbi:MAG: class I SAM-dependent methyltransferase [Thermoanaerobaculia bacterium]